MKVLLDIRDDKAFHLLEVLKGLSYVKTSTISDEKALLIEESKEYLVDNIKAGLEEVRLFKQGKLKTTSAKEFLNEL